MAAEPGTEWFPLANTDAKWTVSGTGVDQKLNFNWPDTIGPIKIGTAIATNFGGFAPPYTGMNLRFRTTVSADPNKATIIVLGSNAAWGGQGIVLDITKERIFACKNFIYFDPYPTTLVAVKLSSNEAAYQAAISGAANPHSFIIDVSAAGLITVTVNGVVCATSYQPDEAGLNLLNTNPFILFAPSFTGYKLRDVIVKKGNTQKSYFPNNGFLIAASSNDVAKGVVSGGGTFDLTSDVTLVATPTSGNMFVKWTEGGVDVSTANTLTFSATAPRTLVAVFDVSTGVDQTKQNNMGIYPNPTKGEFTLSTDAVGKEYRINNLLGQHITGGMITSKNQKIDVSNQKVGTYMIVIQGENGKMVKTILKN